MSTTASRKTQEARQQQSFELGDLDHMIGYQLRRAQTTLFHNFSKRIGHRNITPGQFGLLIKIKNNPGVSQTGLARAEGIERSTLGEIIDRFEKRELVERRRHAEDRRAYELTRPAHWAWRTPWPKTYAFCVATALPSAGLRSCATWPKLMSARKGSAAMSCESGWLRARL